MYIVDEHGWMCTHTTDTVWCPCALRIKHSPMAMNAFRRSPDISASMESTMSRLANWEGRGGGEGESLHLLRYCKSENFGKLIDS